METADKDEKISPSSATNESSGNGIENIMWSCGWGGCGPVIEENEATKETARNISDPVERIAFLKNIKKEAKERELAAKEAQVNGTLKPKGLSSMI